MALASALNLLLAFFQTVLICLLNVGLEQFYTRQFFTVGTSNQRFSQLYFGKFIRAGFKYIEGFRRF